MTLHRAMAALGCAGLVVLAAAAWLAVELARLLLSEFEDYPEPGGGFGLDGDTRTVQP